MCLILKCICMTGLALRPHWQELFGDTVCLSFLWKDPPHLELAGVELRADVCRLLLLIRKSSERMIVCE